MTPKAGASDSRKLPSAGTPTVTRSSSGSSGSIGASSRYTPPIPAKVKGPSPTWVPVLLFGLLILGSLIIILNYMGLLPNAPQNYYLLIGLAGILGGILVATQYH